MDGKILHIAALALLGLAAEATGREQPLSPLPAAGETREDAGLIRLAQAREVEVYYDRYGREVLVDIYTGEVVAIRERQPVVRAPQQDRYYLDDPDDVVRLRRQKRMEELGRAPPPPIEALPSDRGFPTLPREAYPEYPEEPFPEFEDEYAREEPFVEEPRGLPQREQVERAPLDDSSILALPGEDAAPDMIIEPPGGGLPDVTKHPEISHSDASEDVAKIQILLDRSGASPGVIDGRIGDNVNKAIGAYRELTGETLRTYDKDYIDEALAETGGDAFTTYEITDVDVAGPFVASVPDDYGEKAKLERLGFVSVSEMLAERFHMDEKYLRALNPGLNFDRPGTIIKVANVGDAPTRKVSRIIADKGSEQVMAYDENGKLVATYPATIGSQSTPSPSGTHTVERVALNPEYTYNPKINFKQGDNDKILTIPPGPNGPVGSVWIALSKPTYGIHGTPEPSKIGKTNSNGCIRLTNWDAQELAKLVEKGVTVEFVE